MLSMALNQSVLDALELLEPVSKKSGLEICTRKWCFTQQTWT
jgi:hypothetical protein